MGLGCTTHLCVTVGDPGEGAGRSLIAVADIDPDDVLLSVPMTHIFASQIEGSAEGYWASEMAFRLLQECAKAQLVPRNGTEPAQRLPEQARKSDSASSFWSPWLQSLPASIMTPLRFTEADIEAVEYAPVAAKIRQLQVCSNRGLSAARINVKPMQSIPTQYECCLKRCSWF